MPLIGSTLIPWSAAPASVPTSVKGTSSNGFVAKEVTQILSVGSFAATNALAAAVACSSGAPLMEREWSTARQMLRAAPRFWASTPEAGTPFSISCGGSFDGFDVTTVACARG